MMTKTLKTGIQFVATCACLLACTAACYYPIRTRIEHGNIQDTNAILFLGVWLFGILATGTGLVSVIYFVSAFIGLLGRIILPDHRSQDEDAHT